MLEISSRLWISTVVGRRSYRNVKIILGEAIERGRFKERFLFTTDGFEPYDRAAVSMLSFISVYAQAIKKRRRNRVTQVTRKLILRTKDQLEDCLQNSEDSSTITTSFVELHNLTIRRGNSYLHRKTSSHAKYADLLDDSMALQMCHYNFIRPHLALKFGKEVRTPAMQAGIVSKKLSFRDIFISRKVIYWCLIIWMLFHRQKLTGREGWSRLATVIHVSL